MMRGMRTTLTIDDYLMRELKDKAHRMGKPLKQVVNETIRNGLQQTRKPTGRKPYVCKTFSMGYPPPADLDKALALAMKLEDEEIIRKMNIKK